jgi:hypothetical protein
MENMCSISRGDGGTGSRMKEWSDRRAHQLYSIATTSMNGNMRREALLFLGALERAGSEDAAWAMDSIRRQTRERDVSPLAKDMSLPPDRGESPR